MKRITLQSIIIAVAIASITSTVWAQEDAQYLFDAKKVKLSGFGNTNHEFSMIDGSFGVSSGGSGAFLFNYSTFIGIYSRNVLTNHYREDIYSSLYDPDVNPNELPLYTCNKLRFEHGGLWVGYIHNPNKLFHWGANVQLGGGKIALYDRDLEFHDFEEHHRDRIGVITPEFDVELNLARWFKINMGLGYRFVLFVDDSEFVNKQGESARLFSSNQFSSPVASIKLMFGAFGPRKNGKNGNGENQ
jgi:hypothetical protein